MVSENRISERFNIKKIASDPELTRQWLVSQAVRIESLASEHPETQSMVMDFADELADLALSISPAKREIHRLIEGKARRLAKKLGFSIQKSRGRHSERQCGLFRLLDHDHKVIAGRKYDLAAEDVISLCRKLLLEIKGGSLSTKSDFSRKAFEELYNHEFPDQTSFTIVSGYEDLDLRNAKDQIAAQKRFSERLRECRQRLREESQYLRVKTFGTDLPECI